MAYDTHLAQRIRAALAGVPGLAEQKMFGGVGFTVSGNLACGVQGDSLIVRLGPGQADEALKLPAVRPFAMTGRPMKGWIFVGPEGFQMEAELSGWVTAGVEFAGSLPAK